LEESAALLLALTMNKFSGSKASAFCDLRFYLRASVGNLDRPLVNRQTQLPQRYLSLEINLRFIVL
jgi:hypothetical protein